MWSATSGEKLGEHGWKHKELGTKAVQGCADSLEGELGSDKLNFPGNKNLCNIES